MPLRGVPAASRTRSRPMRGWVVTALLLAWTLLTAAPAGRGLSKLGGWDWDKEVFFSETQRVTVLRHRQFPLWNPWAFGGVSSLAFPESTSLAPSFLLLVLPLGSVVGLKLKALAGLWLGGCGAWVLARRLGHGSRASLVSALAFMFSGYYALHLWIGHTMWAAVALVPWVVAALWTCEHPSRATALAAVLVALMVFEGALYIVLFTVLFVVLRGSFEALRTRRLHNLLWSAVALAGGLLLAGVKLVPMLWFLTDNPRVHVARHAVGANTVATGGPAGLYHALFYSGFGEHLPFEDGAYVGVILGTLALAGAVLQWRSAWPLYATGVAFLVVAMGNQGIPGSWDLLHRLPILRQTIFPMRYLFGLLLPIALAAAAAVDWLERRLVRAGKPLAGALLLLVAADLAAHSFAVYVTMFEDQVPRPSAATGTLLGHVHAPSEYRLLRHFVRGYGVLNAHQYLPHPSPAALSADDPRYRGELEVRGEGRAEVVRWSPNAVDVRVEADAGPVTVVVNANDARGWRVAGAGRKIAAEGRLAAEAAQSGVLRFFFRPPGLAIGAGCTLLAAVAAVVPWCRRRVGR